MGGASMGGSGMGGASMGGSGTGGASMGGSGMGGASMGGSGMGGASMGGSGMGGASMGGMTGGLNCSAALQPTGGLVTSFADYSNATGQWGPAGGLQGSRFAYGGGPADASVPTETATVDVVAQNLRLQLSVLANGYAGGGISFDSCVTAAAYTQLQFTITGTLDGCPYQVQLQTFEQRPTTLNPPGGCTSNCNRYPPATGLATPNGVGTTPVTVTIPFTSFSGWTSNMATELVGIQWQVNSSPGACSAVDIRIDDVKFVP
jgi:hypothetical protein